MIVKEVDTEFPALSLPTIVTVLGVERPTPPILYVQLVSVEPG